MRNVVERLIILSGSQVTDKEVENFVAPTSPTKSQFRSLFREFRNVEEIHSYIDKEYASFKD